MLLDIVKQIVAKNGEQILLDPQRVDAFLSDMAKDEPEFKKKAFIECLNDDAVIALKNAIKNKEALADCKKVLAERMYKKTRRDIELYQEVIDILCEVLSGCTPDLTPKGVVAGMADLWANKKNGIRPDIQSKHTTSKCPNIAKNVESIDTAQKEIVEQKHDDKSAIEMTIIVTLIALVGQVFFYDIVSGKLLGLLVGVIVILFMVSWNRLFWRISKLVLGPTLGVCLGSMVGNWLYNGVVGGFIGVVVGVILGRLVGDLGFRNPDRITIQKLIIYSKSVSVRWIMIVIVIVVALFVVLLVKVKKALKMQFPLNGTTWEYVDQYGTKYLMEYDKKEMLFASVDKDNKTVVSKIKLRYILNGDTLTIINDNYKEPNHIYNYSGTYIKNDFDSSMVYTQLIPSAQTRR